MKINSRTEWQQFLIDELTNKTSLSDILLVFGSGFDKEFYKESLNWMELNYSLMQNENIEGNNLLSEPRISKFNNSLVSSYLMEKIKMEGEKQKTSTIKREKIKNSFPQNKIYRNLRPIIKSMAHSQIDIMTTNFRMPSEIAENKQVIDLTADQDVDNFSSHLFFAHGHLTGKGELVYSKSDFDSHYHTNTDWTKILENLNSKLIFMVGFSGMDNDFLQIISKAFVNKKAKMYFLTGDFCKNPNEEKLVEKMLKTVYNFQTIFYDYKKIPTHKMILDILRESNGNQVQYTDSQKILKNHSFNSVAEISDIFKPGNLRERITNKEFSKLVVDSNINLDKVKESNLDMWLKLKIVSDMNNKKPSLDKIEFILQNFRNNFTSMETKETLYIYSKKTKNLKIKGRILYLLLWEGFYIEKLSPKEAQIVFAFKENEDPFRNQMPTITFNSIKEVFDTIISWSNNNKFPLTHLLNLSSSGPLYGLLNSIQKYYSSLSENEVKKLKEKLQHFSLDVKPTEITEDVPIIWILATLPLIKFSNIKLSEIWDQKSSIKFFSSSLPYFKTKYVSNLEVDIPVTEFPDLLLHPNKHVIFGLKTENKKWSEKMLIFLKENPEFYSQVIYNNYFLEIVKDVSWNKYVEFDKKIRKHNWSSRTIGDGTLDDDERKLSGLIKRKYDFRHVFESWKNNNEIEIDAELHEFFRKLEACDFNNFEIVLENPKYSALKGQMVYYLKEKFQNIFSKETINHHQLIKYMEHLLFHEKKEVGRSVLDSIKLKDTNLFHWKYRSFFEMVFPIKNNEKPNKNKNTLMLKTIFKTLKFLPEEEEIIKLWCAYYIFDGSKSAIETLNTFAEEDLSFAWWVLNARVKYFQKELQLIFEFFQKNKKILIRTIANDDVSIYNQKFVNTKMCILTGNVQEITKYPEYIDHVLLFLINVTDTNIKEQIKLKLDDAIFQEVSLVRMGKNDIHKIPQKIFKKIIRKSKKITIEKILLYVNHHKKLQESHEYMKAITTLCKNTLNDTRILTNQLDEDNKLLKFTKTLLSAEQFY